MKNFILVVILAVICCSCNQADTYVCNCVHKYMDTGIEIISNDTIENLSESGAEIECSNYSTSDDANESMTCKLKK